ncbi:MAG: hypothetical protein AB7O65_07825 [Candidatus Korobacteraceae bacterium]
MASLFSSTGDLQLGMRLLATTLDPFQQDMEWFECELFVEGGSHAVEASSEASVKTAVRGRLNRQEFNQLVAGLDELLASSRPLRFEPADLKFYFEWSHETPSVFLIITWFDLALSARSLEQRFPVAHVGYRFLADRSSLRSFREQLEGEFHRHDRPATVV